MAKRDKKTRIDQQQHLRKTTAGQSAVNTDVESIVWAFDRIDRNGPFAFDLDKIERNNHLRDIFEKMIQYEGVTWGELKRATHDGGRSKHHFLNDDGICTDGIKRIELLCPQETERIFSFALENTLRIIGIRDGVVFHVMWYDPKHEFYQSRKK